METKLKEAMASGVLVEFRDDLGNTLGTACFPDWRGRPVPAVGDRMNCRHAQLIEGIPGKLAGKVQSRHFDVQTEEDGGTCVWVRLVVRAALPSQQVEDERPLSRIFSEN
jgi:hypothetical protein